MVRGGQMRSRLRDRLDDEGHARCGRPGREDEMELDKIRNLGPQELKHEEQQASEQLFRLRFQMRLGQTEGVKKLRGLKKDIARIKTITRERELGLNAALHGSAPHHSAGVQAEG